METNEKKLKIGLTAVVGIAVIIGILIFAGILNLSDIKKFFSKEEIIIEPDAHLMTSRNAYDIALLKAREWKPDAMLAYLNANSVSARGRSNTWKIIFISKSIKNKGFLVEVEDYNIISVNEISYSGVSADFPVDILSTEDAVKIVRGMKGYENVEIYGVEVINMGKLWYWGIKTSKGVVSVKGK